MVIKEAIKDIPVRILADSPNFDTPKYWFDDDIFLSHFFNAISSTFPEGERFFIRSVRHYETQVKDPTLRHQISAFVSQEGRHSKEHDSHVQILLDQGYTSITTLNRNQREIGLWLTQSAPRFSLALTTAIEHITAILADEILRNPQQWNEPMHLTMQPLWRWHAIEETEHKAVAFDVYQLVVGKIWMRRIAMLQATLGFLTEIFIRHSLLLMKDRAFRPSVLWGGFKLLWQKQGFLRVLVPSLNAFYANDFHPWQHDNTQLLLQRREQWGFQP